MRQGGFAPGRDTVTAATFAAILWHVAGSASFTLGGVAVVIPSYMAIAAILYAVIVTVGHPRNPDTNRNYKRPQKILSEYPINRSF